MDTHNTTAYMVGAIFGAVFVGILCGLLPLAVGRKRERLGLGWVGLGLCVGSGFALGLFGAVPMAGLWSLVILVAGPPKRRPTHVDSGLTSGASTPQPYDL